MKRFYFILVALFWVTMNALLWRSEMGASRDAGSPVPAPVVWEKILTAPDDSQLQLLRQGRKLGYCRWAANVGEELATGKTAKEEVEPEGRVRKLAGYTLDCDGNFLLGEPPQRLRFNWHAEFGTNQTWRKMSLRLMLRPNTWEVRADAQAERLTLRGDDSEHPWERTFTFAELAHPETLLGALGNPWLLGWLGPWAPGAGGGRPAALALGLNWDARQDWVHIGHATVRAYRLQARWLDKYQAVVSVSRVGEILRVELPEGIQLVNEALTNLAP